MSPIIDDGFLMGGGGTPPAPTPDLAIDQRKLSVPGSTGAQVVTFDLGGRTPKAVLFVPCYATGDEVAEAAHACFGVGASIGPGFSGESWGQCSTLPHNVAARHGYRSLSVLYPLYFVSTTGGILARATITAVGPDTITLNWVTAAAQRRYMAIAIAGDDVLDVACTTVGMNGQPDSFVVDLGFRPSVVFAVGSESPSDSLVYNTGVSTSFGFVHDGPTFVNAAPPKFFAGGRSIKINIGGTIDTAGPTSVTRLPFPLGDISVDLDIDDDGVLVSSSDTYTVNEYLALLAIRFSESVKVAGGAYVWDQGTDDVTLLFDDGTAGMDGGIDFAPAGAIGIFTHCSATETNPQLQAGSALGIMFADADSRSAISRSNEHGVTTTDTSNSLATEAFAGGVTPVLRDFNGAAAYAVAGHDLTAGLELDIDSVSAAADTQWGFLAIGPSGP